MPHYTVNDLYKNKIRIIQASPKHTGSTLLTNILYGLFTPNKNVVFIKKSNISTHLVFKTHNLNFDYFPKRFPEYKFFYVCSERDSNKINSRFYGRKNVLVINYDELVNRPVEEIVKTVYDKLINMFPFEAEMNIETSVNRVNKMNNRYEEIKHRPFTFIDYFYHLHGSHKNRSK